MSSSRRHFGNVRKLPSGRFQASYWWEGARHIADRTFRTKADGYAYLDAISATITRGEWIDPNAGRCLFGDYANEWLSQRTDLRPLSRDQYASLIANHLGPAFGDMELARISTGQVRAWYGLTSARRPGAATSAYRLLRAIFNTAVTDELVSKNPCRIRGAGTDRSQEREIPTVAQVEALMVAMPAKLRAAVVLAAWGTLRRGEVLGLRRCDVDVAAETVRVERSLGERRNGAVIVGPPKSSSGARTVHMPSSAMVLLEEHLRSFVGPDPNDPLFVGRTGLPQRPQGLEEAWRNAREEVGLHELRFHDLRHFAGTMAANAGASTKEVMARGGWSSPQMALRYEHATQERDRSIAQALELLSQSTQETPIGPLTTVDDRKLRARSRTQRARRTLEGEDADPETDPDQDVSGVRVRPSGFEPETCGLRVRCSAVELEAHRRV